MGNPASPLFSPRWKYTSYQHSLRKVYSSFKERKQQEAMLTGSIFRVFMIIVKTRGFSQADLSTCRNVLAHCYLGDWFVLYQLSKNSNIYFFRYLLRYLEKSFDSQVCLTRQTRDNATCCQARTRARGSSSSHRYAEEDKRRKGLGAGEENGVGLWIWIYVQFLVVVFRRG